MQPESLIIYIVSFCFGYFILGPLLIKPFTR